MCSSHTVSGVMPGGDRASRRSLEEPAAGVRCGGLFGVWLHWRDYAAARTEGRDNAELRGLFDRFGMKHRGVEFDTLDAAGLSIPYRVEIIAPEFAALPVDEAARPSFDAACRAFGAGGRSPAAGTAG
jgi:hypothetical protein